jgi:hypothetical protein
VKTGKVETETANSRLQPFPRLTSAVASTSARRSFPASHDKRCQVASLRPAAHASPGRVCSARTRCLSGYRLYVCRQRVACHRLVTGLSPSGHGHRLGWRCGYEPFQDQRGEEHGEAERTAAEGHEPDHRGAPAGRHPAVAQTLVRQQERRPSEASGSQVPPC